MVSLGPLGLSDENGRDVHCRTCGGLLIAGSDEPGSTQCVPCRIVAEFPMPDMSSK